MKLLSFFARADKTLTLIIFIILIFSTIVLSSIAPQIFPEYYFFIVAGLLLYFILSAIPYEVYEAFSPYFYIVSIILLIITFLLGTVTRGTIRWISFSGFRFQPSEIIRPFLFLYFAYFFSKNSLKFKSIIKSFVYFAVPFFLILLQPSLTVATLTAIGFLGILISVGFNKKVLVLSFVTILFLLPIIYLFLAPYQKERIVTFLDPYKDPYGSGYHTIQSIITIGSGGTFGKGLGRGSQTQLSFLPERHTDFFFASLSEELGFVGSMLAIILIVLLMLRLISFVKNPVSSTARAYLTALFLSLLAQITVNLGMNLGVTPVAGVTLPLFSAGGSSLLATFISLAIASSAKNK